MKRLLTENLTFKLLSVLLAFLLWIAIAKESELATSVAAPILFKNIPDDLDIASNVPDRVNLELRGPERRLSPNSLSQISVVLDLSGVEPGERTFTIHEYNIRQLPMGVAFYRAVPSQIGLRFERLLTKNVPVEPVYAKAPPDGYFVTKYSFDPATVRIRGPEGRVQSIDHVTTDPIDLSGVVSQAERRVHIRLGEAQVRLESNPVVKFTVQLEKISKKD